MRILKVNFSFIFSFVCSFNQLFIFTLFLFTSFLFFRWTSLHPRFLSAPEISQYLNQSLSMIKNVYTWLYNLRLTHPGIFCILLSTIFIVTALIGRFVPGVVIVYIISKYSLFLNLSNMQTMKYLFV